MANRIITISREFGSGGRTIGREVAKKLNIPCYDQELIDKIAEKSGYDKAYIQERGEYTAASSWIGNALAMRDFYGQTDQDKLWAVQRNTIIELAEQESCVIVGRCADYILRDRADCLTVFIHADMATRARRIVELYGESDTAPEKRLHDKDKRRAADSQLYTDTKWGDARHYDVALDSGRLGLEKCVEIIARLY